MLHGPLALVASLRIWQVLHSLAISSKLMGSLDLGDLASASQDGSTSRLILIPTPSTFSLREFFSVIDHPQFLNVYTFWGKTWGNCSGCTKFAQVFSLHCFALYGSCLHKK